MPVLASPQVIVALLEEVDDDGVMRPTGSFMPVKLDKLIFFDVGTPLNGLEPGSRRVSEQEWHDFEQEQRSGGEPQPQAEVTQPLAETSDPHKELRIIDLGRGQSSWTSVAYGPRASAE